MLDKQSRLGEYWARRIPKTDKDLSQKSYLEPGHVFLRQALLLAYCTHVRSLWTFPGIFLHLY